MHMAQFKRGQFQTFRAVNKIHMGKYERDILQDDEFLFDGASVRYAGEEFAVPQLKGLVGEWFVPVADQTSTYQARPAGVEVHAATPEGQERGDSFTMGEADEDHSVVGTMGEAKQRREDAAAGRAPRPKQAATVRRTPQPQAQVIEAEEDDFFAGGGDVDVDVEADADVEGFMVASAEQAIEDAGYEDQQWTKAQPTNAVGAGRGKVTPISAHDQARVDAADEANRVSIQETEASLGAPASRDQMGGERHDTALDTPHIARTGGKLKMQVISADASEGEVVGNYNFSGGATVGRVDEAATEAPTTNVLKVSQVQEIQQGKAVATTPRRPKKKRRKAASGADVIDDPHHTHEPQAVRAPSTTQIPAEGNTDIGDTLKGGATGDVAEIREGDDLADLLPDAAMAGRRAPKPKPPELSEDEEIAQITAGWNKKRNWHTRVQEAVDFYGDWPEALEAICAIESPAVVKNIKSKLAR